ncbi:hypothetical protein [Actinospica robiniae]|uniref:hypothetical protein n=1 Tax=Actinospica robiniae TaxID=304901 RepID=UPI0003F4C299|nr:hypothetical protein [Actinospica robiniae]
MTIERNDQDIYDEVASAFRDVSAPDGPDAAISRGRTLRRRRRTMPALAVVGVVAASLGLATLTQPAGPSNQRSLSYGNKVVNVDNAAFSVHTDARTGYITVTMRQFTDPSALEAILKNAGITADIVVAQVPGPRTILTSVPWADCRFPAGVEVLADNSRRVLVHEQSSAEPVVVLDPSAIPAGGVLGLGYARTSSQTDFILVGVFSGNPKDCLAAKPTA